MGPEAGSRTAERPPPPGHLSQCRSLSTGAWKPCQLLQGSSFYLSLPELPSAPQTARVPGASASPELQLTTSGSQNTSQAVVGVEGVPADAQVALGLGAGRQEDGPLKLLRVSLGLHAPICPRGRSQ